LNTSHGPARNLFAVQILYEQDTQPT